MDQKQILANLGMDTKEIQVFVDVVNAYTKTQTYKTMLLEMLAIDAELGDRLREMFSGLEIVESEDEEVIQVKRRKRNHRQVVSESE